jgi:hypothetical protein
LALHTESRGREGGKLFYVNKVYFKAIKQFMNATLFLRFSWRLERHEEPSQYPQSPGLPKKLKKVNQKEN